MIILALDMAERTGWACGSPGSKPRSGWIRLSRFEQELNDLPGSLAIFIRKKVEEFSPALIAVEQYMEPAAQPSDRAVKTSLLLHGAACAVAAETSTPLVGVSVQTWRRHFCGRSRANPIARRGEKKTARQRADDREANKEMTLVRAKLLGYLPPTSKDTDCADAIGLWDFACATYARSVPERLVLFWEASL